MTMLEFTTAECKKLLPEALITYLWQLAADSGAEEQTFVLSPRHTGTGDVQDILHRRDNFSSWRRVFGYTPVEAVVQVRSTGVGAIMSLQGAEGHPTPGEEAMGCSA